MHQGHIVGTSLGHAAWRWVCTHHLHTVAGFVLLVQSSFHATKTVVVVVLARIRVMTVLVTSIGTSTGSKCARRTHTHQISTHVRTVALFVAATEHEYQHCILNAKLNLCELEISEI